MENVPSDSCISWPMRSSTSLSDTPFEQQILVQSKTPSQSQPPSTRTRNEIPHQHPYLRDDSLRPTRHKAWRIHHEEPLLEALSLCGPDASSIIASPAERGPSSSARSSATFVYLPISTVSTSPVTARRVSVV